MACFPAGFLRVCLRAARAGACHHADHDSELHSRAHPSACAGAARVRVAWPAPGGHADPAAVPDAVAGDAAAVVAPDALGVDATMEGVLLVAADGSMCPA